MGEMNGQCEGCAFTKGAAANEEPQNNLKGQLCVLGGLPFYCHHAKDGSIQDYGKDAKAVDRRELIQSGRMVICQGWKREIAQLAAAGYFKNSRDLKRSFAVLGLGALQTFITTKDAAMKEKACRVLQTVVLALNKERGNTEVRNGS